ncbi:hypothetical protein V6N13_040028 [Hibiscus sabdariffa]
MARRFFRNKQENGNNHIATIYVNNIPKKIHWNGLWKSFGKHGEVLDVSIANKKNKENKRFGFVRVPNRYEALRMIEKMNKYKLFGNILTVSLAKYKERQRFCKKVNQKNRDICHSEGEK